MVHREQEPAAGGGVPEEAERHAPAEGVVWGRRPRGGPASRPRRAVPGARRRRNGESLRGRDRQVDGHH